MEAIAADSNMSTDTAPLYPWSGTIAEVHQLGQLNSGFLKHEFTDTFAAMIILVVHVVQAMIIMQFDFALTNVPEPRLQPPIAVYGVEGRYATALYSASVKQKKLEKIEKDLNQLGGILQKDKIFAEFIVNPLINKNIKKEAIKKALESKLDPLTINTLSAMAENGRLGQTKSMLATFSQIMSAHRNEVVCEVTTAKVLDEVQQKELDAVLQKFFKKGEKVQLKTKVLELFCPYRVDPSIIGGMIVSIGDKYVDMSMSSKIKKYTDILRQFA
ncbi:ATP5O [Cordylochernes scorpioides]|uniref:Oligomycin sensitivity conferral protein n=1 Tax=Cordylochernes scorpioides TaxID=51811 RepID=A0ABY6L4Z4_9ARAC|nr:ATP5O [Cordylochernes scorpioides]